eukprot:Hpha_TRINITY_DN15315_c3_g1::TRINITY_DN15315_c3_g1_i1::g.91348::m.91348
MGVSGGKEKKKTGSDIVAFFKVLRESKQKTVLTRTDEIRAILRRMCGAGCTEMGIRDLLESAERTWERADDELNTKLRMHIERIFDRYDADRSGDLSPDEAMVFFGDFVKEAHAMAEALTVTVMDRTLVDAVRFLRSDTGAALQTLTALRGDSEETDWAAEIEEQMKLASRASQDSLKEMKRDYMEHREERNRAAFNVLDVNGVGGLSRFEVILGLLPGTALNHAFCNSLGFTHPERGELALVPGVQAGKNHRILITEFFEAQRDELQRCNCTLETAALDVSRHQAEEDVLEATVKVRDDALSSKGQLEARLRPLLERIFLAYDRDASGALEESESAKLFDDFVTEYALVSAAVAEQLMFESLIAHVGDSVKHITRGKGTVEECDAGLRVRYETGDVHTYHQGSIGRGKLQHDRTENLEKYKKAIKDMQKQYRHERKARHDAAFAVLDHNGDKKLEREELVQGFLPGTALNAKFIKALGFTPPELPRSGSSKSHATPCSPDSPRTVGNDSAARPAGRRIGSEELPVRELFQLGAPSMVGTQFGNASQVPSIPNVSQDTRNLSQDMTDAGTDSFAPTQPDTVPPRHEDPEGGKQ